VHLKLVALSKYCYIVYNSRNNKIKRFLEPTRGKLIGKTTSSKLVGYFIGFSGAMLE
jgi:hypothetical protein